jgi:hypothetical protein
MSDKDFNNLMELAKKHAQEKPSKEEALRLLVLAGILDNDGNFTPPYSCLEVTPRPH